MSKPSSSRARKRALSAKFFWGAVALVAAVALFFAGFFTYYATLPGGVKTLLWMKGEIDAHYYYDIDDEAFWSAAIGGAEGLLDEYSGYYSAEEYAAVANSYAGQMEGTGLSFFTGTNRIVRVAVGSPVFFAGSGDTVAEEGMYLTGVGTGGDLASVSDYEGVAAAFAPLREGDAVTLRFSPENDPAAAGSFELTVTFAPYIESYVLYSYAGTALAYTYDENGAAHWSDVSEHVTVDEAVAAAAGVAYIRIVRFAGDLPQAFAAAAVQYREDGASSLLLDLRNNGGGTLSSLRSVASYLLRGAKSGAEVVQSARYKNGAEEEYRALGNYFSDCFGDSRVYVAANSNSASASEALIGAMLSYGTIGYADIYLTKIGDAPAKTYGKGIMQTTYTRSGAAITLTTAQIYWPNGVCIHGKGVTESDLDASGSPQPVPAASNADGGNAALAYILSALK